MLEETDQHVGILLDYLKQVDELDDTYFIFTSDNGSECIPITRENRRYNGPLQEGKYSCFEGGIRVPLWSPVRGSEEVRIVACRSCSGICLPPCMT